MNRPGKIILALFLLLIAAVGVAGYFFWQYSQTKQLAQNGGQVEVAGIVAKVEKHVILPEGETPTAATVSNVSDLQDQPFFRNAQNGFVVLVYQQSGIAILYDPQRDRVVNMAQINPSDAAIPPNTQDTSPETDSSTIAPELEPAPESGQAADGSVVQ